MKTATILGIIIGATMLAAAPFSVQWSQGKHLAISLDRADARVGRPATPRSVAGVNRRVHRSAYRGAAAAAGAAAAGAYYYSRPTCGYYPNPPC